MGGPLRTDDQNNRLEQLQQTREVTFTTCNNTGNEGKITLVRVIYGFMAEVPKEKKRSIDSYLDVLGLLDTGGKWLTNCVYKWIDVSCGLVHCKEIMVLVGSKVDCSSTCYVASTV